MAFVPAAAAPLSVCLQLTHATNRADRLEDLYEATLDALLVVAIATLTGR